VSCLCAGIRKVLQAPTCCMLRVLPAPAPVKAACPCLHSPLKLPCFPACMQVHNLNAVKQQLWGLDMEAPCAVGDEVLNASEGRKLGVVTSYADTPSGALPPTTQHHGAVWQCRPGPAAC